MGAENSKIITGLPDIPDNNLDPKLWNELLTVYRAIQNLLVGVSRYSGIDDPDPLEVAGMDPTSYLLGANLARYYPSFSSPVSRGQVVGIAPAYGANVASLAGAATSATPAIGVAEQTGSGRIEVITSGLITSIGGMTPGTLYYLSTTPGAIQNLPPVAAGQIVQPIGWALTSTQMLLDVSSYFKVN